jgi:uncharacterized protein YciI
MPFYVVTMSHPDGPEWNEHVKAHVDYLKSLIDQGKVHACGRVTSLPLRSGLIIFQVADRKELDGLIAEDPFAKQDIIVRLDVIEWDPLFGAFADHSSGHAPELS